MEMGSAALEQQLLIEEGEFEDDYDDGVDDAVLLLSDEEYLFDGAIVGDESYDYMDILDIQTQQQHQKQHDYVDKQLEEDEFAFDAEDVSESHNPNAKRSSKASSSPAAAAKRRAAAAAPAAPAAAAAGSVLKRRWRPAGFASQSTGGVAPALALLVVYADWALDAVGLQVSVHGVLTALDESVASWRKYLKL